MKRWGKGDTLLTEEVWGIFLKGGGIPGIEGNSLFEEALFSDNSGHFESDKKTDLKHRSQVLI